MASKKPTAAQQASRESLAKQIDAPFKAVRQDCVQPHPPDPRMIHVAFSTLNQDLYSAEVVLQELESRLSDVLMPIGPDTTRNMAANAVTAPRLVDELKSFAARVVALRDKMTDLLDRLEL